MWKRIPSLTLLFVLALSIAARSAALTAPAMYADALAKDQAVRDALRAPQPAVTLLNAVRSVVLAYESVVRRYPTSSYCDDALWNAAQLSIDAGKQFQDPSQSMVATRLLKRLASEYPSSKWARQAPAVLATLGNAATGDVTGIAVEPDEVARETPAAAVPLSRPVATLTAVTRAVLPDVVRVTLNLDAEVTFRQEELTGPPRVFFDLSSTRAAQTLADRTLRFDGDADILRQIRISRQPDTTLRVVFESAGMSSCSVSPLYSPYRLIIDCLRTAPPTPAAGATSAAIGRPVPRTPGTLARKPVAVPADVTRTSDTVVSSERLPAISALPVLVVPAAPLTARLTVSPMAIPVVLFARRSPPAAMSLPAGKPSISAATLAMIASEPRPAVATLSTAQTQSLLPAPVAPARNLDGGFSMARQLGLSVSRIVIDPGHGGHDPGAKGAGITEASLVLDIAMRLEALLQKQPGVEVILTRREDEFVPLETRTALANRHAADLFLSIHANASAVAQAAGVETYFLNFANTTNAAAVAARENAASGQPMSALPDFVRAIALNNKMDESRDFATQVQRSLVQSLRPQNQGLRDLGVKQAPFVVLVGASMPSVLAEVSFITNEREARLLKGTSYRQKIAEALFAAVQKYQSSLSRSSPLAQQ